MTRLLVRETSIALLVLLSGLAVAGCGGGIPGDAVVNIGGSLITKTTFNHWMSEAAASSAVTTGEKPAIPEPPHYTTCIAHLAKTTPKVKGQKALTMAQLKTQCEQQYKSLQSEALSFLISSQWVFSEASSLGVKISDPEVHKEFVKITSAQFPKGPEFDKFLQTSGQTVSDLLLRVKLNLLSSKVQKKVVKGKGTVTEAEVVRYYKENKTRYGTPEKRNARVVLTKTEAQAKSAKKEIEAGKGFAAVAMKRSIDPTSKANGELKEMVKGEEVKVLSEAIFSAGKHVLGGPVKTPFGYYIYEVVSATPGTQESLFQVKSKIKQTLSSVDQQQALSKFIKEFKKKWKAKTECRSGYMVADCNGYKAPKSGAVGIGEAP